MYISINKKNIQGACYIFKAHVSINRIVEFLLSDEYNPCEIEHCKSESNLNLYYK
jgi:hypothetical protein